MKPIISLQESHDTSLTVYHEGKFYIFEYERYSEYKHHHCMLVGLEKPGRSNVILGPQITTDKWNLDLKSCRIPFEKNNETLKIILKLLEDQFGIENDFSTLLYKGIENKPGEYYSDYTSIIKHDKFLLVKPRHHIFHTLAAYVQSGFEKAFIISYDAGGDNICFLLSLIDERIRRKSMAYHFGHMYTTAGTNCKILSSTRRLDIPGKLMGLSSYSSKYDENLLNYFTKYMFVPTSGGIHFNYKEYPEIDHNFISNFIEKNEITDEIIAKTAQVCFEKNFFKIFDRYYNKIIEEMSGNVILTGGCALNVLVNTEIKKRYPELNIFIPPNPHDSNLSMGMIVDYLGHRNIENPSNIIYSGSYAVDLEEMPIYIKKNECREINLDEIVLILRNGKIMGFINGRCEVGPRALGNRSILCDASYKNMKQILNEKVKFREWFRPFAPICLLEDAPKYFNSPDFNNMNTMSFVVDVKEEYREKLSSITHVDGTARLQTIGPDDNRILRSILQKFDGVLLNTSFNVQGKPILNTIKTALEVLEKTQLDCFVVNYKNKFYLFDG